LSTVKYEDVEWIKVF